MKFFTTFVGKVFPLSGRKVHTFTTEAQRTQRNFDGINRIYGITKRSLKGPWRATTCILQAELVHPFLPRHGQRAPLRSPLRSANHLSEPGENAICDPGQTVLMQYRRTGTIDRMGENKKERDGISSFAEALEDRMEYWNDGRMERQNSGMLELWNSGIMDKTIGQNTGDRMKKGRMEGWKDKILEYWNYGILE
jgi:hypothetical protein